MSDENLALLLLFSRLMTLMVVISNLNYQRRMKKSWGYLVNILMISYGVYWVLTPFPHLIQTPWIVAESWLKFFVIFGLSLHIKRRHNTGNGRHK